MFRYRKAENLLLALIVIAVGLPALWALTFNFGMTWSPQIVKIALEYTESRPLHGMTLPAGQPVALSWETWSKQGFQKYLAEWTNLHFGFRRIALQLYAQMDY